ncbi:hypothetical protein YDYSY3_34360 [Paenibacillus chitinolyticus]|uniref:ParA family protein n=1 Tax=Paenibacillus chitinolyticus TaxID=79263 RepID=UPI0026E4CF84|nr:hypothetical protein [Paenibacillus chitinolyticus]GKS12436.1 hypothetical protein YDYSY3_34360 [Paenibacillus chitinolyticus]
MSKVIALANQKGGVGKFSRKRIPLNLFSIFVVGDSTVNTQPENRWKYGLLHL